MSLDHNPIAKALYQGWWQAIHEGAQSAEQKAALLRSVVELNINSGCEIVQAAVDALKGHLPGNDRPQPKTALR